MSTSRGIFPTTLFVLLRFTPVVTALTIITGTSSLAPEGIHQITDLLIRLTLVLVAWSMSEGALMLWIRERNAGSPSAPGYGVVSGFFALLVLLSLLIFRAASTQGMFLLLLGALSLRGATRAGWEQGRPLTAVCTCLAAHSAVAALSFLIVLDNHLPWEGVAISLAVGSLMGAVETTWYADALVGVRVGWLLPLYRLSLALAPILIGTLALAGRLPKVYLVIYLLFAVITRTLRAISLDGRITPRLFGSVAITYLLCLSILSVCRIYS